ncbi:MAG: hypothetical protein KVP17_003575 [Porospora cf. gigantea B]|uniref:uncharacterized protein n=1 Tax=Porospora cf. gigantea B TaxID=2853592 RepID=UPI003571A1D0|nr:MAG: hypothetical protein KVP17_003575 [Porospora cf. gigantea B]
MAHNPGFASVPPPPEPIVSAEELLEGHLCGFGGIGVLNFHHFFLLATNLLVGPSGRWLSPPSVCGSVRGGWEFSPPGEV